MAIFVSTVIWFLVTFFFQAMFNAMGGIYIFLFYAVASLFFTVTTFLFIPLSKEQSMIKWSVSASVRYHDSKYDYHIIRLCHCRVS